MPFVGSITSSRRCSERWCCFTIRCFPRSLFRANGRAPWWWQAPSPSSRRSPGAIQGWKRMLKFAGTMCRWAFSSLVVLELISAAAGAADLSRYRNFQLRTDLPAVARQTGVSVSQAKVIHLRPALIQELEWRPQPLGASTQREPAKQVLFSFYNGELFQIAIHYDRYETEGMTTADFIEAISST